MQQESDEISSCVFLQVECIMGLAWEWEPSGVPLHNSSLCSLSILIEWKSVQTIIVQSSIELELKSRLLLVERENLQLEYMLDQQNHFCSSKLLEQTTWNVFLGAWMNVIMAPTFCPFSCSFAYYAAFRFAQSITSILIGPFTNSLLSKYGLIKPRS